MISTVRHMLGPLQRRVSLMVSRAVVALVDDSLKMQGLQVNLLANVTRDGVERFQNYGFTSNPHPGAEAIVVSVGGNQDHGIAIVVDDRRYRLIGLAEGEAVLSDDLGQKVHLTRNGIVINGAGLPVTVLNTPHVDFNTPIVSMSGDLRVAGNVTAGKDVTDNAATQPKAMSGMRNAHNTHGHSDPQGGSVGNPSVLM